MKKIMLLVALIVLAMLLSGCSETATEEQIKEESMFTIVERTYRYTVLFDKETKVMYAVSGYGTGSGVFTLLVNEDGSPKIWEEE